MLGELCTHGQEGVGPRAECVRVHRSPGYAITGGPLGVRACDGSRAWVVHCDWGRGRQQEEHYRTFSILDLNPSHLFWNVLQSLPFFSYQGRPTDTSCPDSCQVLGSGVSYHHPSLPHLPTHLPRRVQPGCEPQAPARRPGVNRSRVNRGPPLATKETILSSPEPLEGRPSS